MHNVTIDWLIVWSQNMDNITRQVRMHIIWFTLEKGMDNHNRKLHGIIEYNRL